MSNGINFPSFQVVNDNSVRQWNTIITNVGGRVVDTFQPHFVADNLKELVKQGTVFVVVQDFLLRVLTVFDVNDAHFQLGFDEDL